MGAIITYTIDVPYEILVEDTMLTASYLEAQDFTAALAPPFVALVTDIASTEANEHSLAFAAHRTDSAVEKAHEDLYEEMVVLSDILHHIKDTALTDRFEDWTRMKTTKRDTVPTRLARARGWLAAAHSVPNDEVRAQATNLQARIDATQGAVTAHDNAEEALADFKELGGRKALVDRANGLRKSTHGSLGEIAHTRPGLPATFPESFFRRVARRSAKPELIKQRIASTQKVLEKLQQQLSEVEADRKAADEKAAEDGRKKLESERDAAQKRADAALEQVNKLNAKLAETAKEPSEGETNPSDGAASSQGASAETTSEE